ncbi:DUF1648 domain-containing protein [Schleiferilactobacillus harbinensis]|uniref:DUF1648 domain-containing protein n=1 Tax=Schleiferilactobacillus harbinensis TaxID=304207 RepID=UPI0021A57B0C|nr:DUF1648 domain-containing protein [Schleiferilactobacillus harbinensis]MCT2909396.1 DUF1648 domain-containing protein [Schleiferilactobacillus harbinensis]
MAKKSWVSKAYWGFYIANFIVILIYLGISWWLYQQAPDRIPVHWNAAGQVDSYGNRIEIFIACLVPLIGVILHPRLVDRKYPESSGSNISTKSAFAVIMVVLWVVNGILPVMVYQWIGSH